MALAFIDFETINWGSDGFGYALTESHMPGLIVAGILIVLSIISWSVMFSKMGMVGKASRQNYRFVHAFRNSESPLGPYEANMNVPGSPIFYVYRAACRELSFHLLASREESDSEKEGSITPDQMDAVRGSMDRAIGEMTVHLESRMTGLATAVSGAPFLGLLGTVWGVMETFASVAKPGESAASLQNMAPGVAAALVTTVIALLVAIPAMFGYNFLINRIRTLILEMHNFSAEISSLFERQFVDFNRRIEVNQQVVHQTPPPAAAAPGPAPMEDVAPPSMSAMGSAVVPALEETTRWRPMAMLEDDSFTRSPGSKSQDEYGVPINPIAQQTTRRKQA